MMRGVYLIVSSLMIIAMYGVVFGWFDSEPVRTNEEIRNGKPRAMNKCNRRFREVYPMVNTTSVAVVEVEAGTWRIDYYWYFADMNGYFTCKVKNGEVVFLEG